MNIDEEFEAAQKAIAEAIDRESSVQPVKQVNIYDKRTGKLLSTSTSSVGKTFGVGWCMCKKDKLREAGKLLSGLEARLILFLYGKQTYGEYVSITAEHLARELVSSPWRIRLALQQLQELNYVKKVRIDGNAAILLNPHITACGRSSVRIRRALWNVADDLSKITKSTPQLATMEVDGDGVPGNDV